MIEKIRIAIDGPASSGKSTVSKIIAKDLGIIYLDTGAMYRAATLIALELSVNQSAPIIAQLIKHPLTFDDNGQVFLGNRNVTADIRGNDVTAKVSEISAIPEIREFMVEEQRRIAIDTSIIMDGRDIGTVVLPDAELKIFLVADVRERAKRRYKENIEKGIPSELMHLMEEIEKRDKYDSTREIAPLKEAQGAIKVDTTGKTIEEVVSLIEEKVKAFM